MCESDQRQADAQVNPQTITAVLSILRDSGIADHVSELDAPLAGRIVRAVLGASPRSCKSPAVSDPEGKMP